MSAKLYYYKKSNRSEQEEMSDEITPEREAYLIDQVARYIVKHDLEDFATIAIEGTAPFGDVVGEMGIMMTYPIALTFFNRFGADFVKMLGFNYQVNSSKLLKRIKELADEKHALEEREKELRKLQAPRESWFSRLSARISSLFKRKDDNQA